MADDNGNPPKRARGRARGRVAPTERNSPPSSSSEHGSVATELRDMFLQGEEEGGRSARGSSSGSQGGARRSGSPHGSTSSDKLNLAIDYVVTRPSDTFDKKGNEGSPLELTTNYYGTKLKPSFLMALYSIKLEPPVEDVRTVRGLIREKSEAIGPYLVTGFELFTTEPIRDETILRYHVEEYRGARYTVSLDFKRNVAASEGIVVQFHNSLIRMLQRTLNFELLGRHYFDPQAKREFPSWKLNLWPGFENSIRYQENELMLNVNSVWKVVQTESVFRKMDLIRRELGPGHGFEDECRKQFVGIHVVTTYNNKSYRIDRIDFESNANSSFERSVRGEDRTRRLEHVSYMNYYQQRYQVRINQPAQPMLVSEPTTRDIRRGQVNPIYLVPELCFPCGLNDEMRGNFRLMKDLAQCLHMSPSERVATMQDFMNRIGAHDEIKATLKKWGILLKYEPVRLYGRKLPVEDLWMGNNVKIQGNEVGDFTTALRGVKMYNSVPLMKWAMIYTNRDAGGVGNLVQTMKRVATPLGYEIRDPLMISIPNPRKESYDKGIDEVMAKAKGKIDLIFIVLTNNNADVYSTCKRSCTVRYGVPSQCFLSKNVTAKGLMSICTKMVIQMAAKQGGEPWVINNPMKTAMVLGYDVHHAGQGSGGKSVAAMVATIDASLGKSFSVVQPMPADRQEIGPFVAGMFESCLKAYFRRNGRLPERVMMYRDGVGEGQVKDVVESELQAFKDRIKGLYTESGQGLPKLTYIIVNKRISTRFFVRKGGGGSHDNPTPGTVVDDVVTRPERYDFFLVSQTARQGCVSPTYYNVIFDESNLAPEKLQKFTYRLCYLYYNWTGTVSVPGPCQNAHKFAFQAGTALKGRPHQNLEFLMHYL